jgi:hypothetical protein
LLQFESGATEAGLAGVGMTFLHRLPTPRKR